MFNLFKRHNAGEMLDEKDVSDLIYSGKIYTLPTIKEKLDDLEKRVTCLEIKAYSSAVKTSVKKKNK